MLRWLYRIRGIPKALPPGTYVVEDVQHKIKDGKVILTGKFKEQHHGNQEAQKEVSTSNTRTEAKLGHIPVEGLLWKRKDSSL